MEKFPYKLEIRIISIKSEWITVEMHIKIAKERYFMFLCF